MLNGKVHPKRQIEGTHIAQLRENTDEENKKRKGKTTKHTLRKFVS